MIESFLSQAKTLIGKGQRAEARRLLHRTLGIDPNNVEAWLLLAGISAPRASVAYLKKAIALDPNNPIAQAAFAWAQRRLEGLAFNLEIPAAAEVSPLSKKNGYRAV